MANNQTPPIQSLSQTITVKLTENNFLVWKQQVLPAIYGYGLESYVSERSETPSDQDPTFTHWKRQDQLLASWLLSSLTESILVSTVGLTSSKEIWQALESRFATQSRAKVMHYRLQLQTMKKRELPMREYLNKIKSCCDLLAAAGQKLTEEEQISYILSGLGSDYNSVMVSVNSRLEPYTLRELHALLLSLESRLESLDLGGNQFDGEGSAALLHTFPQESSYNSNKRGSFSGRDSINM